MYGDFRYKGTMIENRYGPGNGTIWLDDVHCIGNETSIADCYHNDWGVHNCGHREDVSVSCGTFPVQYGNYNNNSCLSVIIVYKNNTATDKLLTVMHARVLWAVSASKMRLRLELCPKPRWEAYSAPRPSSWRGGTRCPCPSKEPLSNQDGEMWLKAGKAKLSKSLYV